MYTKSVRSIKVFSIKFLQLMDEKYFFILFTLILTIKKYDRKFNPYDVMHAF